MPPNILPVALTVARAVDYSGLSRSRLYDMMRRDELPSFQVGGRRMIYRSAIDAFFHNLGGRS